MKIYDESKTSELVNFDLEKGYLEDDVLITRTQEIPAIQEQGHVEFVKEYKDSKGNITGKDYAWVIDVPGKPAVPSQEIVEHVKVYIPYAVDAPQAVKELQAAGERTSVAAISEPQQEDISLPQAPVDQRIILLDQSLNWFEWYDAQISEYHRCVRLGIQYDKNIQELDQMAQEKAKELSRLKSELSK